MELVCSRKLNINDTEKYLGKEINLEYYLLCSESDNSCTYGIQISMTEESGEYETAIINDVLPTRDGMMRLIRLMYNNSVTPTSARDVIYDCIA